MQRTLELEKLIAKGGMGEVWRARDGRARRRVAVKLPRTDIAEAQWARRQFRREIGFLEELHAVHGVPALLRVARLGDRPCAVMRLVNGVSMEAPLHQRGHPPLDVTATLVSWLMIAATEVHRHGINHCDIKPANVLLERGTANTVQLIDFGVACHDDEEPTFRRHLIIGTTGYMSPEHLVGLDCNPAAVDCWSIAVVAYELLTGRRPFAGPGLREMCVAVMHGTYVHPTQLGVGSAAVDAFFERAFAPRLASRFSSLEAMQREWDASTHPTTSPQALQQWLARPLQDEAQQLGTATRRSNEESAALHAQWSIPAPGKPLFSGAPAKVDTENPSRGPPLLIAGGQDHSIPPIVVQTTLRLYRESPAITELHEFADRGHSLTIDSGWREVAQYALDWLKLRALGAS